VAPGGALRSGVSVTQPVTVRVLESAEKMNATKPPESRSAPVVEIAPKYLTSDRNAAEMSAACTRVYPRV
jgi:hypothetical protein